VRGEACDDCLLIRYRMRFARHFALNLKTKDDPKSRPAGWIVDTIVTCCRAASPRWTIEFHN
jgi:hypothetical protein